MRICQAYVAENPQGLQAVVRDGRRGGRDCTSGKTVFDLAVHYQSLCVMVCLVGAPEACSVWPLCAFILRKFAAQLRLPGLEAHTRVYSFLFDATLSLVLYSIWGAGGISGEWSLLRCSKLHSLRCSCNSRQSSQPKFCSLRVSLRYSWYREFCDLDFRN